MKRLLKRLLFILSVYTILVVFNDWLPFLRNLEHLVHDLRIQLRVDLQTDSHEDLVLVGIDESSLSAFGQWPWRRSTHAELLKAAEAIRPRVFVWDILFTEPSELFKEEDANFAQAAQSVSYPLIFSAVSDARNSSQIGVSEIAHSLTRPLMHVNGNIQRVNGDIGALLPFASLGDNTRFGFVDVFKDADGKIRKVPLVVRIGDALYPSLVLETIMAYYNVSVDSVKIDLDAGVLGLEAGHITKNIPIASDGSFQVNYRYEIKKTPDSQGIRTLGYSDLFVELLSEPERARERYSHKILMVAQIATGLTDIGPSPLAANSPLVLNHLNALDNILKNDYLKIIALPLASIIWGILSLLPVVFENAKPWKGILLSLSILVLGFVFTQYLFVEKSVFVPTTTPMLGFVFVEGILLALRLQKEHQQQAKIKGMFSTYLAPSLVNEMVESGKEPALGGIECEITAFFTDIESFSSFSERIPPDLLVELMNDYLSEMGDILQAERGTLDKFIGDAIVAMFGAPLPFEDHAIRACRAACKMQKCQQSLHARWQQRYGDRLPAEALNMRTRIGMNSGRAIVGNIGSRTRFNYTMMGDTVNLAARCESGSKSYGVYTLVSEATKQYCEGDSRSEAFVFRHLDKIIVKGRTQAIDIYELLCLQEDATDTLVECKNHYEAGLAAYFSQDWERAIHAFNESARCELIQPNPNLNSTHRMNPSLLMIERCKTLKLAPPTSNWDGVYVMKSK